MGPLLYRAVVLSLALAFVSLVLGQEAKLITQDLIDEVNNHPAATWRAGHNQFSDYSVDEIKKLLGTKMELKSPGFDVMPPTHIAKEIAATIPDNFDSRVTFAGCIHPIRNQAQCGSCWAFGATEALSDRFCIASNGTINVVLSPQDLVSCDELNMGCNGGQLFLAWMYMKYSGVVSESCFPYQSQTGNAPSCPSTCANGQPFAQNKYFASQYYKVSPSIIFWERVVDIQKEIMANGPVEAAFSVYQDFMAYKSGVYQHLTGSFLGGHAIKIIGWGVESGSGTPYWLVANSWGPTWGEQGFFKILRGKDECGIEAEAYAGTPDVAHAPKH